MAIAKATLRTVHTFVADRVAFNCNGTLTGAAPRELGFPSVGKLPVAFRDSFRADITSPDAFVVYSYQTPIAWFANGEWKLPMVKYSVTTTRHMSAIRVGYGACRQLVRV